MLVIPFEVSPNRYNVFVALEQGNIDRMKAYDPAQLEPKKLGAPWEYMRLGVVMIGFASAEDSAHIANLFAQGKGADIPAYLSRGFTFRPELGDHDRPYQEEQA